MSAFETKMLDQLTTAKRFVMQMIERGVDAEELVVINAAVSDALRLHQIEVTSLQESNDRLRSKVATNEMAESAFKIMRLKHQSDLERLSSGVELMRGIAEAGLMSGMDAKDMAFRRIMETASETLGSTCVEEEVEQQDGFFPEVRVAVI